MADQPTPSVSVLMETVAQQQGQILALSHVIATLIRALPGEHRQSVLDDLTKGTTLRHATSPTTKAARNFEQLVRAGHDEALKKILKDGSG